MRKGVSPMVVLFFAAVSQVAVQIPKQVEHPIESIPRFSESAFGHMHAETKRACIGHVSTLIKWYSFSWRWIQVETEKCSFACGYLLWRPCSL